MDTKAKILDIAMNLNRIGNWAADGYQTKKKMIHIFLQQTSSYIYSIDPKTCRKPFRKTYLNFLSEYKNLVKFPLTNTSDELVWAEKMMTWGNILTHRAKLLYE